jgi:hypothetical protein
VGEGSEVGCVMGGRVSGSDVRELGDIQVWETRWMLVVDG